MTIPQCSIYPSCLIHTALEAPQSAIGFDWAMVLTAHQQTESERSGTMDGRIASFTYLAVAIEAFQSAIGSDWAIALTLLNRLNQSDCGDRAL